MVFLPPSFPLPPLLLSADVVLVRDEVEHPSLSYPSFVVHTKLQSRIERRKLKQRQRNMKEWAPTNTTHTERNIFFRGVLADQMGVGRMHGCSYADATSSLNFFFFLKRGIFTFTFYLLYMRFDTVCACLPRINNIDLSNHLYLSYLSIKKKSEWGHRVNSMSITIQSTHLTLNGSNLIY